LLVDDEPGMLRYIRTLLEVDGHKVDTASTGEEAVERIQKGLHPDLVLLDLEAPGMRPVRDPLREFVYHAADRAVRDVFVDGRQVVADRQVMTLDQADAAVRVRAAQERMESAAPQRDYLHRTAEEITPLSLPVID